MSKLQAQGMTWTLESSACINGIAHPFEITQWEIFVLLVLLANKIPELICSGGHNIKATVGTETRPLQNQ